MTNLHITRTVHLSFIKCTVVRPPNLLLKSGNQFIHKQKEMKMKTSTIFQIHQNDMSKNQNLLPHT